VGITFTRQIFHIGATKEWSVLAIENKEMPWSSQFDHSNSIGNTIPKNYDKTTI